MESLTYQKDIDELFEQSEIQFAEEEPNSIDKTHKRKSKIIGNLTICQFCPQIFNLHNSQAYYKHVAEDHMKQAESTWILCKKCPTPRLFPSKNIFKNHDKNSHRIVKITKTCPLCPTSFTSRISLERHINKFHKKEARSSLWQKCSYCYRRFQTLKRLRLHLKKSKCLMKLGSTSIIPNDECSPSPTLQSNTEIYDVMLRKESEYSLSNQSSVIQNDSGFLSIAANYSEPLENEVRYVQNCDEFNNEKTCELIELGSDSDCEEILTVDTGQESRTCLNELNTETNNDNQLTKMLFCSDFEGNNASNKLQEYIDEINCDTQLNCDTKDCGNIINKDFNNKNLLKDTAMNLNESQRDFVQAQNNEHCNSFNHQTNEHQTERIPNNESLICLTDQHNNKYSDVYLGNKESLTLNQLAKQVEPEIINIDDEEDEGETRLKLEKQVDAVNVDEVFSSSDYSQDTVQSNCFISKPFFETYPQIENILRVSKIVRSKSQSDRADENGKHFWINYNTKTIVDVQAKNISAMIQDPNEEATIQNVAAQIDDKHRKQKIVINLNEDIDEQINFFLNNPNKLNTCQNIETASESSTGHLTVHPNSCLFDEGNQSSRNISCHQKEVVETENYTKTPINEIVKNFFKEIKVQGRTTVDLNQLILLQNESHVSTEESNAGINLKDESKDILEVDANGFDLTPTDEATLTYFEEEECTSRSWNESRKELFSPMPQTINSIEQPNKDFDAIEHQGQLTEKEFQSVESSEQSNGNNQGVPLLKLLLETPAQNLETIYHNYDTIELHSHQPSSETDSVDPNQIWQPRIECSRSINGQELMDLQRIHHSSQDTLQESIWSANTSSQHEIVYLDSEDLNISSSLNDSSNDECEVIVDEVEYVGYKEAQNEFVDVSEFF